MSEPLTRPFPPDFVWGAATASYQIEGAATADGRGESIWDRFCATPGKVRNGDTGAVACDFYHRYPEDVALAASLGLDAFRFSISWPRVLPDGRGRVNAKGLDFYDRLVDTILAQGMRPFPTLYHWDLPQALEDEGGWTARSTAEAFVEYTETVARRLGDRIGNWITHNEPFVAAWLGYGWGWHAPGRTSEAEAIDAAHHLLLSHGWATEVLRRESPAAEVGITLDISPAYPASDSAEDSAAAHEVDGFHNRWFLEPVFHGAYPNDMLERFEPPVEDGDLAAISAPIDFLGVNNYSRWIVQANPAGGEPLRLRGADSRYTDMGWEVYPEGLHRLLVRIRDDYAPAAIYVTENGAAYSDLVSHDGEVHDHERQTFLAEYIAAVGRAVADDVPVAGYFVWSLLDNFEWAHGYWKRFGIVHVDYPTLRRLPKLSALWYRDFIAGQRVATAPAAEAGPAA
jgi:beta-glucosidase